ncbi:MAG: YebC/PmpR family DNA-binding transcriptional regulator [Ignavibacteriae bacterium]|nr:YebC/PmpR family DNA-binding transcriptional regulator [Ignavibacteriota bacterium]MCB9216641.1 YebC/PmpR family DNA-binding transcriptional regulator [Ignavibacteria bacterium]
MAGHSKWANIKHRKAASDAKRGKIFTRIAKELTIAARDGGGDPDSNPRLRLAMQQARAANMPNDNIDRAVKRGTGELEGQTLEQIMLEGYGPGGIGILIECVTDNRNRTVADVRHALSRNGGSMADAGSVAWNFSRKSVIAVEKEGKDEEEILLAVIDAGAEDVKEEEETFDIYAEPENFDSVREAVESAGYEIKEAKLAFVPNQWVELSGGEVATALKLLDALDDQDDVQNVFSNVEISEDEMAKLS